MLNNNMEVSLPIFSHYYTKSGHFISWLIKNPTIILYDRYFLQTRQK